MPLSRKLSALVAAWLLPWAVHATDDAQRVRAIVDGAIGPLMTQHRIPGMAVAVTQDDRAYVFTYGVASRETLAPVTEHTLFEIGSISKVFTATLATYAQASGRLKLSDPPGKHLPRLKGSAIDRATLLQLGTYTAGGLPLQFPDSVSGDAAVLAYFRDWQPLAAPGAVRAYSNPSIGLLGLATASALGEPFAQAMQTRIFAAFGMTRSHVRVPPGAMADYAWGDREGRPVRMNPGPLDAETYGIKTTAGDLLRFVRANIDPGGLDVLMRRAVMATQIGHVRAGPLVQGLGWEQYGDPVSREWLLGGNAAEMLFEPQPAQRLAATPQGPRLYNKTGSTGGFGAYVAFVPARRIGIVMLANRNVPIPARVEAAWTILDGLAPGAR